MKFALLLKVLMLVIDCLQPSKICWDRLLFLGWYKTVYMQSHSHIGANVYIGNLSTPTPPHSLSATRLKAQEIDVGEKAVVAHTCLSGVVGSGKARCLLLYEPQREKTGLRGF